MLGGQITPYFVCEVHSEVDDFMVALFTPKRLTLVRHSPLNAFLTDLGPLLDCYIRWIKVIARVVF